MRLKDETIRLAKKNKWINETEHYFYHMYFKFTKKPSKKQTDWIWLINSEILRKLRDK